MKLIKKMWSALPYLLAMVLIMIPFAALLEPRLLYAVAGTNLAYALVTLPRLLAQRGSPPKLGPLQQASLTQWYDPRPRSQPEVGRLLGVRILRSPSPGWSQVGHQSHHLLPRARWIPDPLPREIAQPDQYPHLRSQQLWLRRKQLLAQLPRYNLVVRRRFSLAQLELVLRYRHPQLLPPTLRSRVSATNGYAID